MTWDQIRLLEQDGFEIGNHTKDHLGITDKTVNQLDKQLTAIEDQCDAHGIQNRFPSLGQAIESQLRLFQFKETWDPLRPSRGRAGIPL